MANFIGTSGDDSLLGTAWNDSLIGFNGRDLLEGGPGNDTLDGGYNSYYGDTAIYLRAMAGVQVDLVSGSASGGDGNDLLIGIEDIFGSVYDDVLIGNDQRNVIFGEDGKDILNGAGGDDDLLFHNGDTVTGGSGYDSFVFERPWNHMFDTKGAALITDLEIGEGLSSTSSWELFKVAEFSQGDGSTVLSHDVQISVPEGGTTHLYWGVDVKSRTIIGLAME